MTWRHEAGRFDPFGLELPFAQTAIPGGEALDYSAAFTSTGDDEGEALAWLDLEQFFTEDALVDEGRSGAPPPGSPREFLGGKLWSSTDETLRVRQAIFVSPAALAGGKVEVLFYVHGLLGPCGGLPRQGVAAFISGAKFALGSGVVASGRPIVLVVPQFQPAADKPWSTRKLADPAVLNAYLARRMAEVGRQVGGGAPELDRLTVAGHSKAYEILYRLARAHAAPAMAEGALSRLTGLWLLDASYGRFPQEAMAALLAAKPGLTIKQVYRARSATDKFGGRRTEGRLALIPVPAASASHCAIPARCLPALLGERPVAGARAVSDETFELGVDEFDEREEFDEGEYFTGSEAFDEGEEFAEDDAHFHEDGEEPEAEARCPNDEAMLEDFEPTLESESWADTADQQAFRDRVLSEHVRRTEKRKKTKALPNLTQDQLGTIPGTRIQTRKDTAIAAGILLSAVNAALVAAKAAGDPGALKIRSISVTSGYRSGSRQLSLWRGVFRGYYNQTQAAREQLAGGPHSSAAVAYMLKPKAAGGFGLGGRIAAPGFSNHQSGAALDFLVTLANGKAIKLDSRDTFRAIWRQSWWHKWMLANAAHFGFHPIPTEEWHWEYRPKAARAEYFDAFDTDEAFAEDEDLYEALDADEPMSLDEGAYFEDDSLSWEADEALFEDLDETFETVVNFSDLAPEPFRVRGGLYSAAEKKKAAQHPAGLVLTAPVPGPQEKRLARLAPATIAIGKELTLWEERKLGIWTSKFNRFVYYFSEVVTNIGRLRDLLSAGAGKSPTDLTPLQKRALRPTDDSDSSFDRKTGFRNWREAAKAYRSTIGGVSTALQELERRRRTFWAAQGDLLVAIAEGKQLTKPEMDALELGFGDLVSVATADSIPVLALGPGAAVAATVIGIVGDLIRGDLDRTEKYQRDLRAFKAKIRTSNDKIKAKVAAFDIAGEEFWAGRKALLTAIRLREEARIKANELAGLFGQALSRGMPAGNRSRAEIRMPVLVASAWWNLAYAALNAKKLAVDNLTFLQNNGDLFDRATFIFDRPKANSTAHEDIRTLSRAAKTLKEARLIISDEDVTAWVELNNAWDKFFINYYR